MKRYFLMATISAAFITAFSQATPATILANKIAQKMKDSLALDDGQKQQLYDVNMLLHQQKMTARQQRAGRDSLAYFTQKVENKRDSLYRRILPGDKYQLYLSKKTNLVNND